MFDDIPIPKARAGKTRFNLCRKGLTDKQLRTLGQAEPLALVSPRRAE